MTNLLIGLLGVWLSSDEPAAASNLVAQTTGLSVSIPNPDDPVEKEYKKVMLDDDAAQAEVDRWIRENNEFTKKGGGQPANVLNARINDRFAVIKKEYENFLKRHPDHSRGHLAYGSFLNDMQDEEAALAQFEKARELDPKNAAAWNQAANYYGHRGPVAKAFEYYDRAIELDPTQALYYQNLATVVYLFRKDSTAYYKMDEQQIFDKAMALYAKAVKLDPNNFELAHDLAQTYYGITPLRGEDALKAWTNALAIAGSELEKEGVYVHLARIKVITGQYEDVRHHLDLVTNDFYKDLKSRILHNLNEKEQPAEATNAVPNLPTATNSTGTVKAPLP